MSSDKRTAGGEPSEDPADRAGPAGDDGRPAPGSGLERRQEHNSTQTEQSQDKPDEGQPAPDPKAR